MRLSTGLHLPFHSLVGAVLWLCPAVGFSQKSAEKQPDMVAIRSMAFQPATLTVHRGDTIIWSNSDIYTHNVVSGQGTISSPDIETGKTWRFVARRTGTFAYHCVFHPNMRGTLIVR
ncbi:cupredoxin family copper-binding protein [soil metagenome]